MASLFYKYEHYYTPSVNETNPPESIDCDVLKQDQFASYCVHQRLSIGTNLLNEYAPWILARQLLFDRLHFSRMADGAPVGW